jgi:aminoglycoside phosphotransferase (APT) family kinase protein
MPATPPDEILRALSRMRLLNAGAPAVKHASKEHAGSLPPPGERPNGERLTGGVSSDIWRIDLPSGPICIKRALARLKVEADWRAPVERNRYEARWMQVASLAAPGAVPALLGQDEGAGMLAMEYLPPDRYPLWKSVLRNGIADPAFAALVAATIARIHGVTAADPSVAERFATDALFRDIRLEPYLIATGRAHPDVTDRLNALVAVTAETHVALVHGDVSPKNILVGPHGPVFLDAECAWWGDPAFDLAFCLNHLLLKCVWVPAARQNFLRCFDAMTASYLPAVTWEAPAALEARAAHLLPALLLARVDGKSPVEYITTDVARNAVRRFALRLLIDPPDRLADIGAAWACACEQESAS